MANVMHAQQEPLEFSLDEELDVDESANRISDDNFPESDDSIVCDDNGNIDDEGDNSFSLKIRFRITDEDFPDSETVLSMMITGIST